MNDPTPLVPPYRDDRLGELTYEWMGLVNQRGYSYNFSWLGRPIIQYPQDLVAIAEIIHRLQPDLIVETGVAHGGSLQFYASIMALEERFDGPTNWRVVGVEVDLREEARQFLGRCPFAERIQVLEGSSLDSVILEEVRRLSQRSARTLVILDSNHSHDHVLQELRSYSPLVSAGSYCIVLDTVIEMIGEHRSDRPWRVGSNPLTAVKVFLSETDDFEVDEEIDARLVVSAAPSGFLRRQRGSRID